MAFVVLRSLAVYGATAALALWLANRFAAPVRRFAGLLLAAAPLLLTGKAMLTGGVLAPLDIVFQAEPFRDMRERYGIERVANPLLVDVASQMLPWRQAVRESVLAGRFPLWNEHMLAGEPLAAVQQPAVLYPGTWLGFLLPPPQAWTFDLTLRIFLALLFAYVFFRGSGAGETASLLGAAAWAFSDFLIFFVGYPVSPSVAPFPLLLLGLRRLAERGDRRAVGLTVAALVLVTVAGHPETLLFCVTGGGIAFLFELAQVPAQRRRRALGLALLSGALALGLTAVVLLPFLEILPQTWQHGLRKLHYARGDRSESLLESLRRLTLCLVPYAYGTLGKSEVIPRLMVPAGYGGSLLLPFALAGLSARDRRKWLWAGLALFGVALHMRLWGITEAFAALPLFDIAILDYFVYLWVFGLAALAVLGAEGLREGRGTRLFFAGAIAAASVALLVTAYRAEGLEALRMSSGDLRERVLLQVVPVLAALVLVVRAARRGRFGTALVALLAILFLAQRALEESHVYPTYPARSFYPRLEVLDPIPRGEPVRMTALWYAFTPNVAAMYGVEDVRGYEAMLFGPYVDTYRFWCQLPGLYYNRVTDPTRPFLSFLNVRYVLSPSAVAVPEGWTVLSEGHGVRLIENPKALPRAFVPRNVLWTDDPGLHLRVLERIPDFENDGVAGGKASGRVGWQHNGAARLETRKYTGGRLELAVDAPGETFIGTSIPAWKGWKLSIDGKRAPLHPFNHAFLGFEAPAGRHDVVLRYLPDGFVWGLGVSLASVLACAGLSLRKARLRTSP